MKTIFSISFALAVLMGSPVQAASVSYYLDQSNVSAYPDEVNYLQVTINDNDGKINFTVDTLDPLGNSAGIQKFGFNTDIRLSACNFAGLPANWSLESSTPGNLGGFGKFTTRLTTSGSQNRVPTLSFSIVRLDDEISINDFVNPSLGSAGSKLPGTSNPFFAVHVAGLTAPRTSSAYFAGLTQVPVLPDIHDGTTTPVPLPPAVWLLASGLATLAGIARRRALSA